MKYINTTINWRHVLRYFIKASQRAEKQGSIRKINKRYPYIHPGKKTNRQAEIAVSVDQSGSVSDKMLAIFFAELDKLSDIATFTVIPFDHDVAYNEIFVWNKGQKKIWKRVKCGGTDFNPPTDYVNKNLSFDGHIILTDLQAPKPKPSKVQRMWMAPIECVNHPYFQTNERVIPIDIKMEF